MQNPGRYVERRVLREKLELDDINLELAILYLRDNDLAEIREFGGYVFCSARITDSGIEFVEKNLKMIGI